MHNFGDKSTAASIHYEFPPIDKTVGVLLTAWHSGECAALTIFAVYPVGVTPDLVGIVRLEPDTNNHSAIECAPTSCHQLEIAKDTCVAHPALRLNYGDSVIASGAVEEAMKPSLRTLLSVLGGIATFKCLANAAEEEQSPQLPLQDEYVCEHPAYKVRVVSTAPLVVYLGGFLTERERSHLRTVRYDHNLLFVSAFPPTYSPPTSS
jgi:hypothetical protein